MTDRIGGAKPLRPRSRVVLVAADGRVLLLRRSASEQWWPGYWDLPGGGVEDNESDQEAAQRELLEETGLSAQFTGREAPWWGDVCGGAAYEMHEESGELRLHSEHDEAQWFFPSELPEKLMAGMQGAVEAFFPPEPAVRVDAASTVLTGQEREDAGEFSRPRETPEGFVTYDAWATRVGVFNYMLPDGTVRRELRLPEHVFLPSSLATLPNKPVTDEHPPELVDASTASRYTRGSTGARAWRDGDYVRTELTIFDAPLNKKVKSKAAEQLSCGYKCDLVMQAGKWRGLEYDAIQTNITYNHLAVVPRGRAGVEVRLRTDAARQMCPTEERKAMTKTKIDGVELEVSEAAAVAISAWQAKVDAERADRKSKAEKLQEEMDAKQKELDSMKSEMDKLSAKKDALDEELTALKADRMDGAKIQEMVSKRAELQTKATKLAPALKLDGLDDIAVMRAALEAAVPGIKLDGKSDDYVLARFDMAVEGPAIQSPAAAVLTAATIAKNDGAQDKVQVAQAKMRTDSSEAWQKPLGVHKAQ